MMEGTWADIFEGFSYGRFNIQRIQTQFFITIIVSKDRSWPYLSVKCQMKSNLVIFCIIAILCVSEQKFQLESDWESITEEGLLADPHIQVEGTSKHFNIDQYQLTHLKFVEVGKNKRKTYENFIRKYKKITDCLIKHQIVPHETAMIHSSIQMNFISKKRVWQFSRVFVIYSDKSQLTHVLNYLEPFKLSTLKERVIMGYLNEKLIAIKAFSDAKTKLERFLKKKINSKLEITYVVDIQIKGRKFVNEEDIESQIKKQNNYSNSQNDFELVTKGENKNRDRKRPDHDRDSLEDDATMRVLFKVGEKAEEKAAIQVEETQYQTDDSGAADELNGEEVEASPDGELIEDL